MPDRPPAWSPRPFRPARWLPGGHAHTIAGRLIRPREPHPFRSERVELPDGDFVDLHEDAVSARLPAAAPAVLILHGLEGCYASNYVASAAAELARFGVRAIRFNFRGCSGEMNRLPRFYHAGETDDLAFVLDLLRERAPTVALGAVGFSLGGNMLLKYLGERGGEARRSLRAAVAVSIPFDLAAGTAQLERPGLSRAYTRYFVRKLRRKALRKREMLAPLCRVDLALASSTIRGYDDAVTAPLHGYRDSWHYYRECSSARFLPGIRLPTLVLHSLDDPFLPPDAVPVDAIHDNPWIVDGLTGRGGHVGFIEGTPTRPRFWAEEEAARFLHQMLGGTSKRHPAQPTTDN